MVRRVLKGQRVDGWLDYLRLRFDAFPRAPQFHHLSQVHYQPMPILGMNDAGRAEGTVTRWGAIAETISRIGLERGTAVDIGANTGFFTIGLARMGFATLAIEPMPSAYRTALYAIRRANLTEQAGVAVMTVTPDNLGLLPTADVVLFLSLWHHFVMVHGVDEATAMLEAIWSKTERLLFFESGEAEMPSSYGLPPFEPDATTWLADLLARACPGGTVEHLGLHQAFDADRRLAERNLFVVVRDPADPAQPPP